jgi:uncharacterized protein
MKPRVNIITLGVADVAVAKAFYTKLGLTEHAVSNEHIGFFDLNGVVLSVYGHSALADDAKMAGAEVPAFRGISLAWNVESPSEVDVVLAQAVAAGAGLVKAGEKVFWGGYSGYFADPDGHLWEVAHNPFVTFDQRHQLILP